MSVDICQKVLDDCSYGLYIVTSHDNEGNLNGQLSDALMQVTACPPRAAVCINKTELTHEYIRTSQVYAASILKESADLPFIGLFGFKSGRDVNKLAQAEHKIGKTGCPLITEKTISAFEVKVSQEVDLGTHTMFIGDVINAETFEEGGTVLTYSYYRNSLKGKAHKNSPSYHENQKETKVSEAENQKYVCDVCGYIYDPAKGDPDNDVEPGTSFADVPEDWLCPICSVGKDEFSPT